MDYYVVIGDITSLFGYYFTTLESLVGMNAKTSALNTSNSLDTSNGQSFGTNSTEVRSLTSTHELMGDVRFQKAANPVFKYDFKVGNYLPDSVKTLNQHLFTTFNDVTGGIRKAP